MKFTLAHVVLGIAAAVACFLVYHLFFSSWDVLNTPPKNGVTVAFGDSLVAGFGSERGGGFVPFLEELTGGEIINLGISGNTTADGVRRIPLVLKEDPGTVIVLLGGNDALRRISRETTRQNLEVILTAFQEEHMFVVLLGVRGGLLGDPYDEMYTDLARAYGAAYVPNVLSNIFADPELTFDTLHPNDAGYAIIAERVYAEMSKY
jgi:acyl-CoA thioesterase-1